MRPLPPPQLKWLSTHQKGQKRKQEQTKSEKTLGKSLIFFEERRSKDQVLQAHGLFSHF